MEAVHTLVAEVLAYLIDAFKSAHDESLQIELGGDTHVHIYIERIEVGDKRTGAGTAGNALQRGGLYLSIASLVEEAAHGAQHGGTFEEGILHTVVDHEVHIALTIAQLGVLKLVVGHTVLILHDRQGLEALAQQRQLFGVNADFAGLGAEDETLDTDKVTDIHQLLEHLVIQVFVVARAHVITGDIHLNATLGVLQLGKAGLTHHAAAHQTAGDNYLALFAIHEVVTDIGRISIYGKFVCGIGIDTHLSQLFKTLAAYNLLFAKF